jgi:hypothetical protein
VEDNRAIGAALDRLHVVGAAFIEHRRSR